jgi:hypothetical protein
MKTVFEIIAGEIKNQDCRFVFPSETAASLWARRSCEFCGERSLALNRFLAWDRFKETVIRSAIQDREPVSAVLRKLFAESLVRKIADAVAASGGSGDPKVRSVGGPGELRKAASPLSGKRPPLPFRSLIPPQFAGEGQVFAAEIAGMLPSLALLRERQGADWEGDDEDRDFAILGGEYGDFLAGHGLFEPAWEKPPLGDREHRYCVFFPEALEDWEEYRELLRGEGSIRVVSREELGEGEGEPLRLYYSSRTEIRGAALELRRLHEEEGVPYEDMALSVPDLGEMESYILRDFGLRDIPLRRRAGKPLADYGAGKLFSLIKACAENNFSFAPVKSLVLNEQIPWRYPALNRALVKFGVTNNCVSGYREGGRMVDVWAEALRRDGREEELRNYYGELKERISALAGARSFAEIRRRYFAFRGRLWEGGEEEARVREAYPEAAHPRSVFRGFLSRDACSEEGDAVLARCVEELSALARLEEEFPDLVPPAPFNFFLAELREKQYVPAGAGGGVNLFPYRVAAAAPFAAHFVLGASQQGATVLYQPLRFLRQDKRKRLGLTDTDASAAFFRLYRPGSFPAAAGTFRGRTWISAAERTFSGWAIPHSVFAENFVRTPPPEDDPFRAERDWWAGPGPGAASPAGPGAEGGPAFPRRLFAAQRRGFENWLAVLRGAGDGGKLGGYNFLRGPFRAGGAAGGLLRGRLDEVQREGGTAGGALKVSATDLNGFFRCPLSWLWGKVFRLEGEDLEARLLDDASLGLLYHEILRELFARIRGEDRFFKPGRLGLYRRWAEECTEKAAGNYPAFQGPLAVPLLVSMARTIAKKVRGILDLEARYFPDFAVAELESSLEARRGDLLFKGRLDRVSVSPEDEPFIMDYKTGGSPTKAESTAAGDRELRDFQIPLYVKLYEESRGIKTGGAFFISINRQDITAVLGSPGGKRGHRREDYQPSLDALEGYIEQFAAAVRALDFAPGEIPFESCGACEYRGVCRTAYSLNAEGDRRGTGRTEGGHVL